MGELYWDSMSSNSYKYPCRATEKVVQRNTEPKIRVFRLSSSLGFLLFFVIFIFCKPRGEDVLMEEGDLLVLRVTIGVSFAFLPLSNKSTRDRENRSLRDCFAEEEPLMAYGDEQAVACQSFIFVV